METQNPIAFIKANKNLIAKGFKISSLASMSEDEMSTLIDTIRNHPDFSEPQVEEKQNDIAVVPTAVDNSYELLTEKGEKVMVFKAPYIGRTAGGAFKFKWGESFIRTQSTALSSLNIRKPISVGEEFVFKVESLKYNPEINCFESALAYFANESIMKVASYTKDTKAYNLDKVAMLISEGLTKAQALEAVREETVASIKKMKRPSLDL
jgi:hypothetical protein